MTHKSHPHQAEEQTLFTHLVELRNRLLKITLTVLIIFIALFSFSNELYLILVEPLLSILPNASQMIATGITSPLVVPLKLAMVASFFLAIPIILHQVWSFISPGLYQQEKKFAVPLLLSSILLFYTGVAFAYYVVLPITFLFFTTVGPTGLVLMPDISNILDFILKMFFAFGIAFEIPIATFLMVLTGLTSFKNLQKKRPYIFLGCFVVSMLLTPPDIISQTVLAIPMWLLFEVGVLLSYFIKRHSRKI
jgi:sec-independent protein translocase protein TatC